MMRHPKNILADPDFNSETELDVDNPNDIVAAEDNQKDFIVDSGFVALSEDDILI